MTVANLPLAIREGAKLKIDAAGYRPSDLRNAARVALECGNTLTIRNASALSTAEIRSIVRVGKDQVVFEEGS